MRLFPKYGQDFPHYYIKAAATSSQLTSAHIFQNKNFGILKSVQISFCRNTAWSKAPGLLFLQIEISLKDNQILHCIDYPLPLQYELVSVVTSWGRVDVGLVCVYLGMDMVQSRIFNCTTERRPDEGRPQAGVRLEYGLSLGSQSSNDEWIFLD